MTSRPWIIALAASAVVNVFLVGGLAGLAYARLTEPVAPAVVTAPVPRVVPPASPAPMVPVAPVEAPLKPPHHVTAREQLATPVAPTPAPPVVAAAPSMDATPAAQARPPLISAGDVLSPDSRKAFRKALGEANKKNKPLTQQARAERQAALAALGSPGYEAAEVAKRLSTARALDLQARGNVEAALASYAATLTSQERAVLAEGLARVYTPAAARRAAFEGPPR
jgi:uncharacterized membrane protein